MNDGLKRSSQLARRLSLQLGAALGLLSSVLLGVVVYMQKADFERAVSRDQRLLEAAASAGAERLSDAYQVGDRKFLKSELRTLGERAGGIAIAHAYDPAGALLSSVDESTLRPSAFQLTNRSQQGLTFIAGRKIAWIAHPVRMETAVSRRQNGPLLGYVLLGSDQRANLLGVLRSAIGSALLVAIVIITMIIAVYRVLERSLLPFHTLTENAPDPIAVHRDGSLVYVNPSFARMLGHESPETLVGRPIAEIADADSIALLGAQEVESRNSEPDPIDCRFLTRDGRSVTAEAVSRQIAFENKPSVLILARDVTDRRALRSQLLLAERLSSVGTLAAGVAHEINNPLTYVLFNTELMLETIEGADPTAPIGTLGSEFGCLLRETLDGGARVREIVKQLTTFCRPAQIQSEPIDVNDAVEGAIKLTWNQLRHTAKVRTEFGQVSLVESSDCRLGQVFVNLLVNASQAIKSGTVDDNEILVRTGMPSDGWVEVTIRDTGIGISNADQARIFDPFFTTKKVGEGTGLGLAICHGIVESVGGSITVSSQPGRGSTFGVRLPVAVSASRTGASVSNLPKVLHTRGLKILVVDDEPGIARTIERALTGHEVTVALTGETAVTLSAVRPFDLVLCDLMMPGADGVEVYERVTANQPELVDKFAFITGGAFTPRTEAFLATTQLVVIPKPFSPEDLRALIRRLIEPGERASAVATQAA